MLHVQCAGHDAGDGLKGGCRGDMGLHHAQCGQAAPPPRLAAAVSGIVILCNARRIRIHPRSTRGQARAAGGDREHCHCGEVSAAARCAAGAVTPCVLRHLTSTMCVPVAQLVAEQSSAAERPRGRSAMRVGCARRARGQRSTGGGPRAARKLPPAPRALVHRSTRSGGAAAHRPARAAAAQRHQERRQPTNGRGGAQSIGDISLPPSPALLHTHLCPGRFDLR